MVKIPVHRGRTQNTPNSAVKQFPAHSRRRSPAQGFSCRKPVRGRGEERRGETGLGQNGRICIGMVELGQDKKELQENRVGKVWGWHTQGSGRICTRKCASGDTRLLWHRHPTLLKFPFPPNTQILRSDSPEERRSESEQNRKIVAILFFSLHVLSHNLFFRESVSVVWMS